VTVGLGVAVRAVGLAGGVVATVDGTAAAAPRLGGGQPSSVGENIAAATMRTSSPATANGAIALVPARRCRPAGVPDGVPVVGPAAQSIRAPYDPVCRNRNHPRQIDNTK
jgi:hypothetical protein